MITAIMDEMIRYFHNDVKRINHALKVYSFATLISKEMHQSDTSHLIICISALLHDIGITEAEKRYGSSSGKLQEQMGPPVARQLMKPYGLPEELEERVCYLIGHHHTYSAIDGDDFQILVEADFLVNFFEDMMSQESIMNIREQIFRTAPGIRLLESMYR